MHSTMLEHYGVPGMRWGRRKSRGDTTSRKSRRTNKKYSPKTKRTIEALKKVDTTKKLPDKPYRPLDNNFTDSQKKILAASMISLAGVKTALGIAAILI